MLGQSKERKAYFLKPIEIYLYYKTTEFQVFFENSSLNF